MLEQFNKKMNWMLFKVEAICFLKQWGWAIVLSVATVIKVHLYGW